MPTEPDYKALLTELLEAHAAVVAADDAGLGATRVYEQALIREEAARDEARRALDPTHPNR